MFAKDKVSQSLIDAVNKVVAVTEAKADELPPIDKDAAAARKARQARLDAIEDAKAAKAERGSDEKSTSAVRRVAGKAYGGSKQKDDDDEMDEAYDCVTKPEAKGIAKKVVKGHEKEMHKEEVIDEGSAKENQAYNLKKQSYRNNQLSNKAHEASKTAKTSQEHKDAYNLHSQAVKAYRSPAYQEKTPHVKDIIDRHLDKMKYHTSKTNEEVEQIDEISLKTKIKAYAKASDDALEAGHSGDDDEEDKRSAQADKFMSNIEKKHGVKAAAHADRAATRASFGRHPYFLKKFKKEEVELTEEHHFGSNVDSHIKSLGHGKIGFIMDQQKDSLIAVHHQEGGKHHLAIFHKGNLANQSTHDNFNDASFHAHTSLTTKKGKKALNLKEHIELDEVSADLIGRYSAKASKEYNDPKTSAHKKSTRRAGLMLGYNKAKARANVPATYEDMSFADRLLQRAWLSESRGPSAGAGETFTDNNIGEMTDAQTKKKEKIVLSMKDKESDFKAKYGKNWKNVMYATATKLAMAEDYVLEEMEVLDEARMKEFWHNVMNHMDKKGYTRISQLKQDDHEAIAKQHNISTSDVSNVLKNRAKQMTKEDKDDGIPFDRPYSKTPAKVTDKGGNVHTPMSRVKHLAKTAMKKLTKETMMGKAGTTSEETENE